MVRQDFACAVIRLVPWARRERRSLEPNPLDAAPGAAERREQVTEEEAKEWGRLEMQKRLSDIAEVKRGLMTLEAAQEAARHRIRLSGMTSLEAYRYIR